MRFRFIQPLLILITAVCNSWQFSLDDWISSTKDWINCSYNQECCVLGKSITPDYAKLRKELKERLFGQHIAVQHVPGAIAEHYSEENKKKPLVISFHGGTGVGKSYVADIIVNSVYKKGINSLFFMKYLPDMHFPHNSRTEEYTVWLKKDIISRLERCPYSIFVFDEVHKLKQELLQSIKPFIDHNSVIHTQNGVVQTSKAVFIFLSNTGIHAIMNRTLELFSNSMPRDHVTLKYFEDFISSGAFNEKGGFHHSELISSSLVDYFVPFLPMERKHVRMCIEYEMKAQKHRVDENIVRKIADDMNYSPKETELFASAGCKSVATGVKKHMQRERSEL